MRYECAIKINEFVYARTMPLGSGVKSNQNGQILNGGLCDAIYFDNIGQKGA